MNKDIGGWLRRKGLRIHTTWSRRWFVLSDKCLMMYSKEGDIKCLDTVHLDKQIIVEPPIDRADPKQGYFDIVNGNETISLCAETIEDKQTWLRSLKRRLYADKGGALFSQSLEEILFWEKTSGRRVPYIVDECVQYLYKYGLEVEGIFRLAGRLVTIKEVIVRFDRGEKIEFEKEETDVHVVASVLKAFLRELPDSIIPCNYYQKFMNIALKFMDAKENEEAKEKCVEDLAKAMDLIPDDNYIILKYVINFLAKVSLHRDKNLMTMMNVGTIFGNNIIRHIDKENSQLILCTADLGQNLVFMLLNYLPKVFVRESRDDLSDNMVATADLLHLSDTSNDQTSVDTTPNICEDLRGLDLAGPSPSNVAHPSCGPKIVEDYYSYPKDHQGDSGDSEASNRPKIKRRAHHLSLRRAPQNVKTESKIPSPDSNVTTNPPIPPPRIKIIRNRPLSERNRPRGVFISQSSGDSSPPLQSPMEGNFHTPPETPTLLVNSFPEGQYSNNLRSSEISQPHDDVAPASSESQGTAPVFPYTCTAGEYGPTREELLRENKKLKDDISLLKERYKKDLSALRSQHTSLIEKYENRIKTMETSFNNQRRELETKLEQEKKTITDAVEGTMALKKELMRYRLKYGELDA